MLAGALAGSATVLITNPIWVVNTRMTARQSNDSSEPLLPGSPPARTRKPSTIATLVKLFREEGPTALFAGVLPALVLVINPILQYTIFEQLKTALAKRRRVLPRDIFILGALGKLAATSITYPYITVKSRMHVATADSTKENMIESLRRIVREEGWKGLYKGELSSYPFLPSFQQEAVLIVYGRYRHRTQSHAVRHHSGVSVRVQGRIVRHERADEAEGAREAAAQEVRDSRGGFKKLGGEEISGGAWGRACRGTQRACIWKSGLGRRGKIRGAVYMYAWTRSISIRIVPSHVSIPR